MHTKAALFVALLSVLSCEDTARRLNLVNKHLRKRVDTLVEYLPSAIPLNYANGVLKTLYTTLFDKIEESRKIENIINGLSKNRFMIDSVDATLNYPGYLETQLYLEDKEREDKKSDVPRLADTCIVAAYLDVLIFSIDNTGDILESRNGNMTFSHSTNSEHLMKSMMKNDDIRNVQKYVLPVLYAIYKEEIGYLYNDEKDDKDEEEQVDFKDWLKYLWDFNPYNEKIGITPMLILLLMLVIGLIIMGIRKRNSGTAENNDVTNADAVGTPTDNDQVELIEES